MSGDPIARAKTDILPPARLFAGVAAIASFVAALGVGSLMTDLVIVLIFLSVARAGLARALVVCLKIFPLLVFVSIMQAFIFPSYSAGAIIASLWCIDIHSGAILGLATLCLRAWGIVLVVYALTKGIRDRELPMAVEGLLRPFARIGMPARDIGLVIAILLRTLPFYAREADRIRKAQRARGADLAPRGRGFIAGIAAVLPLFVPLAGAALRRSESIALAMDARCYGLAKPSADLYPRAGWGDIALCLLALALFLATVTGAWSPAEILVQGAIK